MDILIQSYKNSNPDVFNFIPDEKSSANYEFIKWENDNNTMLIYYEINDLEKNIHRGYFLYDYKNNKIKGILSSN